MDWMDQYLDSLSDGRNAVYPPDSHTWRPVKPTKQQQSLIQDAMVSDLVRMRLIQEARQAEIDAGMGGGYDAGAVNVNPVQSYAVNSDNANLILPGNAYQFNFTINQAVTSFNLEIVGFGSFSLLNNYDENNFANCYLSAYNLNNISITFNPVYVTASETLSSNGQYFTIFYTNTGSVLLSIFKSETIEPVPTPTTSPTLTTTPTPTPTLTQTPTISLSPTITPTLTRTPTPTPAPSGIVAATAGNLVISFGYFSGDTYTKLSNTQWRMSFGDGEYQQLTWNIDLANTWVLDTNNGEIRATNSSSDSSIIPTTGWVYTIGSGSAITINSA